MRAALLLPALLGSCLAAPRPQDIDIDAVEAAPDPVFVTPAVAVASQTLSVAAESAVAKSAAADISTDPAVPAATGLAKRLEPVTLLKPVTLLEGDCSKQTKGSGQVPSDPSPGGYLAYEPFKVGRVSLVALFANDSSTCHLTHPLLITMYETFKGRRGRFLEAH